MENKESQKMVLMYCCECGFHILMEKAVLGNEANWKCVECNHEMVILEKTENNDEKYYIACNDCHTVFSNHHNLSQSDIDSAYCPICASKSLNFMKAYKRHKKDFNVVGVKEPSKVEGFTTVKRNDKTSQNDDNLRILKDIKIHQPQKKPIVGFNVLGVTQPQDVEEQKRR